MEAFEVLSKLWPLLVGVGSGLVFVIRIETKTKNIEKDQEKLEAKVLQLETKHEALDSKIVEQLTRLAVSIARIEGALGISSEKQK